MLSPVSDLRALDHVVLAVHDLAAATDTLAALLGRPPSWRGAHPDAGTANALFRLQNTYVELLAPRGEGPVGPAVAAALGRGGEGLLALAFGTDDLAACAVRMAARGVSLGPLREGEGRDDATGRVRRWVSAFVPEPVSRGIPLFAIEHRSPEDLLPMREPDAAPDAAVAALDHVVVESPDLEASRRLYGEQLGLRLALDRTFDARGLRILFFRIGGVTVEVVGSVGEAPDPAAPDRFGGLAYRVGDVGAARERIGASGLDVSWVRRGAKPGTRVCTVRGRPLGVATLLIGPE